MSDQQTSPDDEYSDHVELKDKIVIGVIGFLFLVILFVIIYKTFFSK